MMKGSELRRKTKKLQRRMRTKRKRRKRKKKELRRKKKGLIGTQGKDTKRPERRGGPRGGDVTDRK